MTSRRGLVTAYSTCQALATFVQSRAKAIRENPFTVFPASFGFHYGYKCPYARQASD